MACCLSEVGGLPSEGLLVLDDAEELGADVDETINLVVTCREQTSGHLNRRDNEILQWPSPSKSVIYFNFSIFNWLTDRPIDMRQETALLF